MPFRIGTGFDIHRLVEGRALVLGGVTIPFEKGLLGHSDGDVIIHATCDAILGALAMGDIGVMFPDTSPETKDLYSVRMLETVAGRANKSYKICNIDCNCICERPRLSEYRDAMIDIVAKAAGINKSQVSIKFRTHEGLGVIGSSHAIAAQAVVLIEERKD
jgi:2-C-methyl-D-erythritol 2,4-cyclodiphosphate synthase